MTVMKLRAISRIQGPDLRLDQIHIKQYYFVNAQRAEVNLMHR